MIERAPAMREPRRPHGRSGGVHELECPDDDALARFALDDEDVGDVLGAHLLACGACLCAWRALRDAALALERAAPPRAPLRRRISRAAGLLDVYAPHEDAAAELLGVSRRAARAALLSFHDGAFYEAAPGVCFSPTRGASEVSLLARLFPGAPLPRHRHLGDEITLVVRGLLVDDADASRAVRPGERVVARAGTEHGVYAVGDEPCCCVVVADGGVTWSA